MSASLKSTKEEKQRAVSKAVLEVIEKDGLLGVTHSKVSRKSGVSRAWIYEYIGKEKGALVEFAADALAAHFARVKMGLLKTKEQLQAQLQDAIQFLFETAAKDPVIIKLYFRFRGTGTPLGDIIKKYEKRWLDGAAKSAVEIFGIPKEQSVLLAELILTLRLGFAHRLVTSSKPDEARENADKIFEYIHGLVTGMES